MKAKRKPSRALTPAKSDPAILVTDLRALIESARTTVARGVNVAMVMLHWQVGRRIFRDILDSKRADYGNEIVSTLSAQLAPEFGEGFSKRNLFRMVQFAEAFPDEKIVVLLSRDLGWSHFVELLPLKKPLQRDFYSEMCRIERWSVRALREKIGGMLYERTALAKAPLQVAKREIEKLRTDDQMSPDLVFRDPYFLDFLGLKGGYSEKDLESAILRDLETFLVELGSDFAFLARQKRIIVDGEDFYIDLLFYHRRLRRLVVIDLKLGRFAPSDMGQMEFYLRWLKKHEMRAGEEVPLGLILCSEKSDERVEVFELEGRGIRVAEYLTALPPRKVLSKRLHEAVKRAHDLQQRRAAKRSPRKSSKSHD